MTLQDLLVRVWEMVARGRLTGKDGSRPMRTIQAELFAGDTRDDIEHFEPYGFSSEPHIDAEPLVISLAGNRNHTVAVCIADRRYRLVGMKTGEVAIFDDLKQKVHLTRDGIEVVTPLNLKADVGGELTATVAKSATLKAASVKIDSPTTTVTGDLSVQGKITGSNGMALSGGGGAVVSGDVVADGVSLKSHTHRGDSGGTTSAPNGG